MTSLGLSYKLIKNRISTKYIVILFFIFICNYSFAQPNKRTNHWFFANNISIDFNTGEPVKGNPCPIDSLGWGSSSIMSDTNGNLLFYSDGFYVYNKNNEKMQNSWAGLDYVQGAQSALCMPKPGSDSLYYVFTANKFDRIYNQPLNFYHTIDMSLNDGLGAIMDTDTLPNA